MTKTDLGNEKKILTSAQEVFLEKGYDGARMQQIADHAGINKALLHYYYRSKEKLFQKVLLGKLNHFLPKVGQIYLSQMPAIEKIEALVDAYIDMLSKNPKLPLFILTSINKYPNFVEYLPIGVSSKIKSFFEKEIKMGNIKPIDPFHFVISIIAMCIFPFVSRPISKKIFEKSNEEYDHFLIERKEVVKSYIRSILIP